MADLLEEQRKLLFEALQGSGQFYDTNSNAGALMQAIMRQVSGEDSPFTQQVVQNMLADNADAGAASFSRDRQGISRAMANAGLSGSGLAANAMNMAQSRNAGATRAGRREVQTRAQLENYNAKIQANTQGMNFLAAQARQRQDAAFQEAGYRAQMHETGDAQNMSNQGQGQPQQQTAQPAQPALATPTPARPTQWGSSNVTLMRPIQDTNYWGGNSGGFGGAGGSMAGSGNLAAANANYQSQIQQQERDRQELQRRQVDWDMQYGGRL